MYSGAIGRPKKRRQAVVAQIEESLPSGAKARFIFWAFMYGLKPVPFKLKPVPFKLRQYAGRFIP